MQVSILHRTACDESPLLIDGKKEEKKFVSTLFSLKFGVTFGSAGKPQVGDGKRLLCLYLHTCSR